MRILDYFKKGIRKETLVFPQVISDSAALKQLDKAFFDNKSPYIISFLFRKYAQEQDYKSAETRINKGLAEKRELSADDKELINNIVSAYKESKEKYVIFDSIGNVMFISEVLDEFEKNQKIPKIVQMTCLLWLYQNIVEIIVSHLSEIFYIIAKNRNDYSFMRLYDKSVSREQHLMIGQLLDYAEKRSNKFTSKDKKTFLHNSELRNRLAHANCFYDSSRKELILGSKQVLTISEFEKEFKRVKDFVFELIYQLNSGQQFEFRDELLKMAKKYQKLGRSPPQKKALQAMEFT